MKYFKKLLILFLLFFISWSSCVFAQSNYSNKSIGIYNSGVAFHNQGQYELAEQKYLQALKLQPNFEEAKKNLGKVYQNLAYKSYSSSSYEHAISYAKRALVFKPNDTYLYDIMARSYSALNDDEKAIETYNKILSIDSSDDSAMNLLALAYIKTNQPQKASDLYKKILSINPDDKVAQQNIKYANYCNSEKVLTDSMNNISIGHIAPPALYRLIKPSYGITQNTVERMKTILDLIWSEPNGRIMLQAIQSKKVPINITQGTLSANATKQQQEHTLMLYGFIPVFTYNTSSLAVNIPFNYISNFNNPNLPAYMRVYNLQVFIHEFGHSYMNVKNQYNKDSIEEELGVSMIGYNIAHKALTGSYLDKEQTETYSMGCLESLLKDSHKNLPVYSGFTGTIQGYAIAMPYPEVYSNLPMMYKKLLAEGKVAPVPNFYKYTR